MNRVGVKVDFGEFQRTYLAPEGKAMEDARRMALKMADYPDRPYMFDGDVYVLPNRAVSFQPVFVNVLEEGGSSMEERLAELDRAIEIAKGALDGLER